jgi:hypothetical protein
MGEEELVIEHVDGPDAIHQYESEDGYLVLNKSTDEDGEERYSFYAFCSTRTLAEKLVAALNAEM